MVSGGGEGRRGMVSIQEVDLSSGLIVAALQLPAHEGKITALGIAGDDQHLVTGGSDSLVMLWRLRFEESK